MSFILNPQITAISVLIVCYAVLFSEKLNRAVTVLLGAAFLILTGILTQNEAIAAIDFNTLALLVGMMIIVGISEKSGLFQFLALFCTKLVRASPRGILIMMTLMTAVLSAFLDNVTTVLLIVPVTFKITRNLKISPYPFLILEIFASNIGGTATLIGDPPNILIGSALGLSFIDFLRQMLPIVLFNLFILIAVFDFFWGRKLKCNDQDRQTLLALSPATFITDHRLLKKSLFVFFVVFSGFILGDVWHIPNGTIALFGAMLMLLLYTFGLDSLKRDQKVEDAFSLVDWTTIFFFVGLFSIVCGLETTGVIDILGNYLISFAAGSIQKTTYTVLFVSAFLSSAIDNIPYTATMIPTLQSIEQALGGREAMMPVWWALAIGACFGGNGTLIASSANVIVAGLADKENTHISFIKFLGVGMPVMIISVLMAMLYLYLRYFI